MSSKEKLKKLSSGTSLGWLDDASYVEDNSEMLEMTGRIALAIIKVMKQKGLTKRDLAKLLDISPQSVSKQLSGNANFTLETMAKYGKILGIRFEVTPTYMGKGVLDDDNTPLRKIILPSINLKSIVKDDLIVEQKTGKE